MNDWEMFDHNCDTEKLTKELIREYIKENLELKIDEEYDELYHIFEISLILENEILDTKRLSFRKN
jgi:hypothetical protein